MSKLVDYVAINNYNNYLLDIDLLRVFDFASKGNHQIYRIVDAMDGITIGAFEYALIAKGLEFRIGLNSSFRYQGLASNILKDVINKIGKAFPNTKYIVCYISLDNKASLKMIKKCGFSSSDDEISLEEGYQEYTLLNPYFQNERTSNDKINFIKSCDEEMSLKLELEGIKPHKISFKKTGGEMEIITDLQSDNDCNIIRFVKTLNEVIYNLAPSFPNTEYFTFKLKLRPGVHAINYIRLFSVYGYRLDTLESSEQILKFKYDNPEYHTSVKEVLTRGLIKEKINL